MDARVEVEQQKGPADAVDQLLGELLLRDELVLAALLLRDVGDGEEQVPFVLLEPSPVDDHRAVTDGLEIVLDAIVLDFPATLREFVQQLPQLRNIPLAVAEFMDRVPDGSGFRNLEAFGEGAVGERHRHVRIKQRMGCRMVVTSASVIPLMNTLSPLWSAVLRLRSPS